MRNRLYRFKLLSRFKRLVLNTYPFPNAFLTRFQMRLKKLGLTFIYGKYLSKFTNAKKWIDFLSFFKKYKINMRKTHFLKIRLLISLFLRVLKWKISVQGMKFKKRILTVYGVFFNKSLNLLSKLFQDIHTYVTHILCIETIK